MVARNLGEWEVGSDCLMGTGVPFEVMKCVGTRQRQELDNMVNVLNTTE